MAFRLLPIVAVLALLVGCTTRNETISDVIPPLVSETPVAAPQQNDQTLRVTILDGRFVSTLYEETPGATRMLVITAGGPYVFEIDQLVVRRELAADAQTVINYDLSAPGEYMMRVYQSTPSGTSTDFASAVLDVQSVVNR
jgi:uncharacterized lipoprotein YajG